MALAPYIFVVGLGVASAALLQRGLHEGAIRWGAEQTVEDARTTVYERFQGDESRGVRGQIVGGIDVGAPATTGAGLMRDYGTWLEQTERTWIVTAAAIALAAILTFLVSWRIDVNVFSLNGMYANRLVRCYLGASVSDRKPNRFSGLSARDDLQLKTVVRSIKGVNMLVHPLADGLAGGDDPSREPPVYPGPYHLVNTAINLVAGGNLAYQERKAGAFLLSPLYCGFQLDSSSSDGPRGTAIDAYRPTEKFSSLPRQLTLGEAVATSGAAALPADNAPFFTGKPDAAAIKSRTEQRLALAQAALDKTLKVKGKRTLENTLAPFDEVFRQLDMAGAQNGLMEETSPDSATRATAEAMSQELS